jgi:hypothetical protein
MSRSLRNYPGRRKPTALAIYLKFSGSSATCGSLRSFQAGASPPFL